MIEAALPKKQAEEGCNGFFVCFLKQIETKVCWFPSLDRQTELPTCHICNEANQADSFFQPGHQWAAISMESSCSLSFKCSVEFTLVPYDIIAACGSDGDIWSNEWGASERWGPDWWQQVARIFPAIIHGFILSLALQRKWLCRERLQTWFAWSMRACTQVITSGPISHDKLIL